MSHNHLRYESEIPSSPTVVTLTGFNSSHSSYGRIYGESCGWADNEHVKRVPVHGDIHTRIEQFILIPSFGYPIVLVENMKLFNFVINLFKFRISLHLNSVKAEWTLFQLNWSVWGTFKENI